MARLKVSLAAAVLGLLVTGCQLQLATDVAVGRDGSGVLELAVALDEELLTLLTDAGFDPAVGLADALASAPGWEFEDLAAEEGLAYAFRARFDDPEEFASLVDDLQRGTGPGDPRVYDDLRIEIADDGSVVFAGTAGLVLPATTGVEGTDIAFDADDLEALLAERGDEFVRNQLRVTFPATVVSHDGDVLESNTVTWELPVGELRQVSARSAPAGDRTVVIVAAAAVLGVVVGVLAVWWWRRRRSFRG